MFIFVVHAHRFVSQWLFSNIPELIFRPSKELCAEFVDEAGYITLFAKVPAASRRWNKLRYISSFTDCLFFA